MTTLQYAAASLRHYWRTNLAAAAGVAVAVATLGGALLVGSSVRASLSELAMARLGGVHAVVTASALFTESLATRLGTASSSASAAGTTLAGTTAADAAAPGAVPAPVPVLALDGMVIHEESGRRATGVQVFGVDDRFWRLHGVSHGVTGVNGPSGRTAYMSPALAAEFGAKADDALQLRVQKPSAIPSGVLQGRRDEPGRAVRLTLGRVLTREQAGEFSPSPRQGDARTIFVPLDRLQRDVDLPGLANMVLVGGSLGADATRLRERVRRAVRIEDVGLRVRTVAGTMTAIESGAGYMTDIVAAGVTSAVADASGAATPVLTYLATAIKANGRETPYSLISALPRPVIERELDPDTRTPDARPSSASATASASLSPMASAPPIWLSKWTADDLDARRGDTVTLDYFLWSDEGGLSSASASFALAGVLPMKGLAVDRDLTPEYPGVSTTEAMSDWDPPFPVDLTRVRKKDEDFWREHRTAPKAFLRLEDGQRLWKSRYGQVTSVRTPAVDETVLRTALAAHLPASVADFRVIPVRADAVAAAAGTTDFGEYFTYFSFFVVVASLLLTALFFRLGIEQRSTEIGTLAAFGFTPALVRRIFLLEGAVLTGAGALVGTAGAIGFTAALMAALRTIWIGAVGTTALHLTVTPVPLIAGALGGIVAGLGCVMLTLRSFRRTSVRGLMSGGWMNPQVSAERPRWLLAATVGLVAVAAGLVVAGATGAVPGTAAFFGSGSLLLGAGLCGVALGLGAINRRFLTPGPRALVRLGMRNASARPSRSLLSVALIAGASFLIVAVGAFRQGTEASTDPHSGTGGYSLVAESMQPLMHDPATPAGRDALNLGADAANLDIARFRLRPGDDASCANLYRPTSPRLLGATTAFVAANRFSFSTSLASTDAERANPWQLLNRPVDDPRVVPVIGDATSLAYAFHVAVGDDIVIDGPDGQPLKLRVMAALRDSVLQSELVMSDAQFTRWFPRHEGFRVFLIGERPGAGTPHTADAIATQLEGQLSDFGFDAQSAEDRLASYHRVENTYLSTFQALGGLGLVLGTFGLGTVLLRNVLERRREMALLRATGYQRSHLVRAVVAESACLLGAGLAIGLVCALVAIGPAYAERGEGLPIGATLGLLAAVAASGLVSTLLATRAVGSTALLPSLKHE
ncbi:MAG: FtsX-like permease family protein [Vicinamibacterales bacterium]